MLIFFLQFARWNSSTCIPPGAGRIDFQSRLPFPRFLYFGIVFDRYEYVRVTGKTRNVLIAAQDVRVAGLIEQYLLQIGYQVHCEYNLDAALERLMKARIDLLIVDGEMPERVLGNFVEAAAGVKPGVPMIAVGISEHEMQGKTLSAFVSAFIEKPFSISDISDSIKETLN